MPTFKKEYFSKDVNEIVNANTVNIRGRYDTKVRLRMNDEKLIIRNLNESDLVAGKTDNDIIHTVSLSEDKRPDLVANKYYGDARLYWVILGANNLREKEQLTKGMVIRIPSKNAIYGSNGVLIR